MGTTLLALVMAIFSLLTGLSIYFWLLVQKSYRHTHTTILISWLLIALFPVILIFSFFPQSSMSGNIFGFSMAGGIAAFILIWYRGTQGSLQATKLDTLEEKIRILENKLQESAEESQAPVIAQISETFVYRLKNNPGKKIALITGGFESVTTADAWVSSENTNMEMSRFYENSVSGIIRYYGAKKDQAGNVVDDIIANELSLAIGNSLYVQPATVLVTASGNLQKTHNVKKIFHVASVQGEVGTGYHPIHNIQLCVTNSLRKADSDELKSLGIKTILFSLMGTGTAKGNLKEIAYKLIQAAISYLESTESSHIDCIYFLAWTDIELKICKTILQQSHAVIH